MSQSLASVIVHTIFSTKGRIPLIHDSISDDLYRYLAGTLSGMGTPRRQMSPFQGSGH